MSEMLIERILPELPAFNVPLNPARESGPERRRDRKLIAEVAGLCVRIVLLGDGAAEEDCTRLDDLLDLLRVRGYGGLADALDSWLAEST